ncbi:MAG TPA: glycosyltransferase family 39 protein [Luteimonas sp.]|nr:glycosyltransferase family 39 protein [Luteimonas sp.]
MLKTRASRDTWLFWIVALLVLGAGLGLRDPWPADEPRFALAAKQMVESGDWLFPHRGIELYSDKPPLFMWLQAAAYTIFGNWRVAFLLPSLLAALGTLWCVVDLGKRLWTRKVGLYAGWALLFALQFTYQAKKAQIDPLVTFWITLANYGLLRHFLSTRHDPQPDWKMWMLGWFAAGLGTITKGVGVLALAMLLPAMFASLRGWRDIRTPLRDARVLLGPLAFVVAAAIWLVPMLAAALSQHDPAYRAYLDDILFHQTAGRYAKSWDHPQPFWYHLGVMLTMWLPPLLALPWALPAWKRRLQRKDARYLLPLAWWVLIVVFFSIPGGKRDVYILPALPMACLALAPLLPGIVRKLWAQRLAFAFGTAFALVALALGIVMLSGSPKFEQTLIVERGLSLAQAHAGAWLLVAIASWGIGSLLWFGRRRAIAGLCTLLAGLWVLYGVVAYPLLNDSSSAHGLMLDAGRRIGPDAELGLVAWKEQNLLMADRPATTFGFVTPWPQQLRRGIAWQAQAPQHRWLLVQDAALPPCVDRSRAEPIGLANRRAWWLLPATAVVGCARSKARQAR